MAKKPKNASRPRNVVHADWKLRKASDYLEYDIHTLASGIDIYLKCRGTEIGNAALDSLLLVPGFYSTFLCAIQPSQMM